MLNKINTLGMTHKEWLAERRLGLGGSDIAAILGLNDYISPYKLWAEKTGRLPETEDNEAMRQGRDLEQYVAERFAERSGLKLRRVNAIIRNDRYPYLHANIDRAVTGADAGLECKTTSSLNLKRFAGGDFPAHYYAQCVHYMTVTEYKRWYLAVLVLGKEFLCYQLTRIQNDVCPKWCDGSVYVPESEIAALVDAGREFWECVSNDTPPAMDGSEGTTDALKAIYPNGGGDTIDLFGAEALIDEYLRCKSDIDKLQRAQDTVKQTLMQRLGDAEKGICGGHVVVWDKRSRQTFDAKAFAKANGKIDLSPYYKATGYRQFEVKNARAREG